jgi:hypothetical protein
MEATMKTTHKQHLMAAGVVGVLAFIITRAPQAAGKPFDGAKGKPKCFASAE